MPPLNFSTILTYSSEDPNHPVENLLTPSTYLKWKSKSAHNEKQEYVVLKLEKLSKIRSIDIGNEHSAFVEVLVSREGVDFQVLLVASSFMTPLESRNSTTTNRVRMFGPDKLNKNVADQKWDRIKVICTQPFNRNTQYGLTFIKIYGSDSENESPSNETKLGRFTIKEDDEDSDGLAVGSIFARRKEIESPLTGAAAIRAASKAAAATPEVVESNKRPSQESENVPEMGFYQLKKKARESPPSKVKEPLKPHPQSSKDQSNRHKPKPEPKTPQPKTPQPKESTSITADKVEKNKAMSKGRKSLPFNQLMSDVVFVMSGYQNPQRTQLRDDLVALGANYKSDWGPGCTHLICAFKNTPKFHAVKGKGKIVGEKWIEQSFKKKMRMPWRRYSLEKNRNEDESEEEIWATEICPDAEVKEKVSSRMTSTELCDTEPMEENSEDTDDEIQKAVENNKKEQNAKGSTNSDPIGNVNGSVSEDDEYGVDTDVDEEEAIVKKDTSALPFPSLNSFLKGKTFFMYGSFGEAKRKALLRYIVAFEGQISDYMNASVNFVLTDDTWDRNFDEALNDNPSLQFVKSNWIWKCCDKQKCVPPQPFLVVPLDEED